MTDFLSTMTRHVLARVAQIPESPVTAPNTLDFCKIFVARPAVIAEIKFASPSRGRIYTGSLTPVAFHAAYARGQRVLSWSRMGRSMIASLLVMIRMYSMSL